MSVPAVIRIRRSGALMRKDIQLKRDRELQQNFQRIKDCRKDFEELSEWLIENLDLPTNKQKAFVAKILQKCLPGGLCNFAPRKFTRWMAEQTDAVDMVEGFLRGNVNDVQEAVLNLKNSAKEETERLRAFVEDIETADCEGWDAKRLHAYLNETAELDINPEIQELLDESIDILSAEEKEKRRLELINRLKGNAIGRKHLIEAHGKVCSLALQVLHAGACQYFDFVSVVRPLKVIHQAAEGMLDMNTATYAAKEVVKKILQLSAEAFECVADATAKVNEFAVSSPDTVASIEDASRRLDGHLAKLEAARNKFLITYKEEEKEDKPELQIAAP